MAQNHNARKVERAIRHTSQGRKTAATAAPAPRRARRVIAVVGGLAALGTVFYVGKAMAPAAAHTATNSPVADTVRTVTAAPIAPTAWPSFTFAAPTMATAPGVTPGTITMPKVPGVTTAPVTPAPVPTVTVTTTATATATVTATVTATATVTVSGSPAPATSPGQPTNTAPPCAALPCN